MHLTVFISLLMFFQQPEFIEVEITFISKKKGGDLRLAWYVDEQSFMKKAVGTASLEFDENERVVKIRVPNKPIAISSYHDLNDDQKLSTNWMGIPNEPYGFSNDARGSFGPPSFSACLFDPSKTDKIKIHLQ